MLRENALPLFGIFPCFAISSLARVRAAIVVSATLELVGGKICGNFLCLDLISSLDASQAIAALTPCNAEGRVDENADAGKRAAFLQFSNVSR